MNRFRKHEHFYPHSRPFDPELAEPDPEPSAHQYECARIELGPWASDAQVTARALELLDDELRLWNTIAADDEADRRLGDYE